MKETVVLDYESLDRITKGMDILLEATEAVGKKLEEAARYAPSPWLDEARALLAKAAREANQLFKVEGKRR